MHQGIGADVDVDGVSVAAHVPGQVQAAVADIQRAASGEPVLSIPVDAHETGVDDAAGLLVDAAAIVGTEAQAAVGLLPAVVGRRGAVGDLHRNLIKSRDNGAPAEQGSVLQIVCVEIVPDRDRALAAE